MYTRKQRLNNECTHRQYHAQFVNEGTKNLVLSRISKDRLVRSQDPHLNDIPLSEWDGVARDIQTTASDLGKKLEAAGDYCTLAGLVCIAKEAARQIIES